MHTSRFATILAACLASAGLAVAQTPSSGSSTPAATKPGAGASAAPRAAAQEADVSVNNTPPIPATPRGIVELVQATPFSLATGYVHEWRKERPTVDAGYLVVVRVEPDAVYPRQVAQPVLMVGSQVVEPLNIGYAGGVVVAIVPAPRKADGTPDLDLSTVRVYFGEPALPESMDAAAIAAQRDLAARSGIRAVGARAATAALARGGEALNLADREALDRRAGALVRQFAPAETDLADQLEGKTDTSVRAVTR